MTFFVTFAAIIVLVYLVSKINSRGIHSISAQEAQALVGSDDVAILDVRTPQEFQSGHLKGARLVPVAQLGARLGELSGLKEKKVLVYCHSGGRSMAASQLLRRNGFTMVSNLRGGIGAWMRMGYRLSKGK